jgi:hypothetical protein
LGGVAASRIDSMPSWWHRPASSGGRFGQLIGAKKAPATQTSGDVLICRDDQYFRALFTRVEVDLNAMRSP